MAKLNNFFGMVVFLLATSVTTLKIGLTLAANQDAECKQKVGKECGKMIVSDMFFQNVTTNDECCKTAVKMGKKCHDELVEKLSTQAPFQALASQAQVRSKKLWDKCAIVAKEYQENKSYIEQCKENVGKECGKMIVSYMFFQNVTTSGECCKKVVKMGKKCHDQLVEKLSTQPPFQATASQAQVRSKQLWDECASIGKQDQENEPHIEECKEKVGKECGKMIVSDMFFQNVTTNDKCCKRVVKMGKKCHDELVGKLSTQPPFQATASQAQVRSKQLWYECALLVNQNQENELYIEECKEKVGKKCGKMIVSDMFFQNATTSDECCMTVVKMGKKCHHDLLKKLSTLLPFQATALQAKVRSKQIWDNCALASKNEKEIKYCKQKVSKKCGVMIVNEMFFNNSTTSDTCCKAVTNMGKHCHEQLLKKFSTLPPFQANASKALSRSKKLWHRCASTHVKILP